MTTPHTVRRQLTKIAPAPACRDVSDLSARRPKASVGTDGADGWETDLGTVAIVHPRLTDAAARALRGSGLALVVDTGTCQVWVRYAGQPQ